jgi:5'(3')-deoxyribonucleotidase
MNDLTDWKMTNCFPKEYEKLVEDLWFNPKLWNRVQPVLDSRMYLDILTKQDNVSVVTDTHYEILSQKIKLLEKCFPCIDTRNNLFICKNKSKIKLDVLTDDAVHNLYGADYKRILLTYRWNINFNCSKNGIHRSDDWVDIYKEIERIRQAKFGVYELTH